MLPHQPVVTVRAGDSIPDSYIISLVDGASVDDVAAAHGLTKGYVFRAVLNGFRPQFLLETEFMPRRYFVGML